MNKLSLTIIQKPILNSFDSISSKLDYINDDNVYSEVLQEVNMILNGTIMIDAIPEYKVLNDYIKLLEKIKNKHDNTSDIILLKKITNDLKKYLNEEINSAYTEKSELFLWSIWLNINELLTNHVNINIIDLFYPIPEFENIKFKKNNYESTETLLKSIKVMLIEKIDEFENVVDTDRAESILTSLYGFFNELYKYNYSRVCKAYWLALKGRIKIALLDQNLELDNKEELKMILEPVKNEISNFIIKSKMRNIENLHTVIISLLDSNLEILPENDEDLNEIYKNFNLIFYKKLSLLSKDKSFMEKYNKINENSSQINKLFKELILFWNSINNTEIDPNDLHYILNLILDNRNLFPIDDNVNKFFTIIEKLYEKYIDEEQKIKIQKNLLTPFANFVLSFQKYCDYSFLQIENWQENYDKEYEIMLKIMDNEFLPNESIKKLHEIDKIQHKKETFKTIHKLLAEKIIFLRNKIDYYYNLNTENSIYQELNNDNAFLENNQVLESVFIMLNNNKLFSFFNEYFEILNEVVQEGEFPEELYKNALNYLGVLSVYFSLINEKEILANEKLEEEYNIYFEKEENKKTIDPDLINQLEEENRLLNAQEKARQNERKIYINNSTNNLETEIEEINQLKENNISKPIEEVESSREDKSNDLSKELEINNTSIHYNEIQNEADLNSINNQNVEKLETTDNSSFKVSKLDEFILKKDNSLVDNNDIKSKNIEEVKNNMNPTLKVPEKMPDELLTVFIEEVMEVIDQLDTSLNLIKVPFKNDEFKENLTTIRRVYHTLKGSSAQMELKELSKVYKDLEGRFNNLLLIDDLSWSDELTDLVDETIKFSNKIIKDMQYNKEYTLDSTKIYQLLDEEEEKRNEITENIDFKSSNINVNNISTNVSSINNITNIITNNYDNEFDDMDSEDDEDEDLDDLLLSIQDNYKTLVDYMTINSDFINNLEKISTQLNKENNIHYINFYNILIDKLKNLTDKKINTNNISKICEIKVIIVDTIYGLMKNELPNLEEDSFILVSSIDENDNGNKINQLYNKVVENNPTNYDINNQFSDYETNEEHHTISPIVLDESEKDDFNNSIARMENALDRMIEELKNFNKDFIKIQSLLNKKE